MRTITSDEGRLTGLNRLGYNMLGTRYGGVKEWINCLRRLAFNRSWIHSTLLPGLY